MKRTNQQLLEIVRREIDKLEVLLMNERHQLQNRQLRSGEQMMAMLWFESDISKMKRLLVLQAELEQLIRKEEADDRATASVGVGS
jgi:hypothetical protein